MTASPELRYSIVIRPRSTMALPLQLDDSTVEKAAPIAPHTFDDRAHLTRQLSSGLRSRGLRSRIVGHTHALTPNQTYRAIPPSGYYSETSAAPLDHGTTRPFEHRRHRERVCEHRTGNDARRRRKMNAILEVGISFPATQRR
jgi:hypothetical protein